MKREQYIDQVELANELLWTLIVEHQEYLRENDPARFNICAVTMVDTLDAKNRMLMLKALDKVATKDPDYWKSTEYRMRNRWWLRPLTKAKIKYLLLMKKLAGYMSR